MPLLRRLKTWILPLALSLMVAAPAHANSSTQPPLLMCPAGQNSSTWTDCRGVVELGGGEVYVGGMRQGRFHGDGAYTWSNGSTYVGQWQNGGRHGQDPNGLFTRALLQEMRVPGVRVDNVIREVRKKVVEAARRIGHEQVPAIYDQVVGDFYFTR